MSLFECVDFEMGVFGEVEIQSGEVSHVYMRTPCDS